MPHKKVALSLKIVGILLIIWSLWSINQWRFQNKFIENPVVHQEVEETVNTDAAEYGVVNVVEELEEVEPIDPLGVDYYLGEVTRSAFDNGMMTLRIPKLEVESLVINGTKPKDLKKGPGLYETSPLHDVRNPNICIAAHRTTYGAWFKNVNELVAGDAIYLEYNNLRFTYEVEEVFVVENNDWSVTQPQGYSALTLTTCHPMYSAEQRMIVRGKLINISQLIMK